MAGRRSKLSEKAWRRLFRWDRRGMPRRTLAWLFGVTVGTIAWQADKRGLKKGQTPGCVDRRRRPEGGWPEDHVFIQSRSGMTPGRWRELLLRRIAGEADADLAAEYGVSVGAISWNAQRTGLRKMDRAEARYLPRGPAQGAYGYTGIRDLLKIDIDREDPVGTVRRLDEAIWARLAIGDGSEAAVLWRFRRMVAQQLGVTTPEVRARFETEVREARLALPPPEHFGRSSEVVSPGPSHPERGALPPPPVGEGDSGVVLHGHQKAPEGDWATWLMLGGRGAGKTFAGAWWLAEQAMRLGAGGRLALVGATLHDVREVMVEGASGLVGLPRWTRADGRWDGPVYEAGRRRVRFPGGAYAYAFSAEDTDSLRGPQFHAAWADEFCAWAGDPGRTLAVLRAGLRLTSRSRLAETDPLRPCGPLPPEGEETPRLVVTTTPRPMRALRELRAEPGFVESRAGTRANAAHLAPGFLEGLERLYGGTRWEAQELEGRIVELDGALWTAELLAGCRGTGPEREALQRVVVAVDPSATAGGNACGIVVAGRNGLRAWVLADRSCAGLSPGKWADRVAAAVREFDAACVVVEVNQGGEMVREVLRASGVSAAVREVRAVRGKRFRAEPVAALYEQGRVMHAGRFGALEEELMALGGEDEGRFDLDRADALVWAVTDLLIDRAGERPRPRVRAL